MTGALLWLAAGAALSAQIQFTRIESPHFELYTDGAKGRAIDVLEHFEKVRSFFAQTITAHSTLAKPRVVVLNSKRAFATFVDRKSTAAYFIALPHRDLIVIGPASGMEDNTTITHEYVHLLVSQAEMALPLWLNEGIAEVYSTLQPVGNKMRVGTPIPSHLRRLRMDWLEMRQVLKAESYGSEEHIGPFYSMSWAIAHMLLLEDDLRPKWPRFGRLLETGATPEEALKQSYGLTPQQLEQHVQGYIRSKTVNVVEFPFKWEEWKEKAHAAPASPLENELTMIELSISGKDLATAGRRAQALTAAMPKAAEPWEALASVRLYERNDAGAAEAIREAFARGTAKPALLARGAALAGEDRELAKQMLDRALATDGRHFEALYQLAVWHWRGGEAATARAAAGRAIESSMSGKNKAAAEKLLAMITERRGTPGAVAAEGNGVETGMLVEVECQDRGQVLHVRTVAGLRKIAVDTGQSLLIAGERVSVGCGAQKRPRRVRVGVSPEGLARKLEFLP